MAFWHDIYSGATYEPQGLLGASEVLGDERTDSMVVRSGWLSFKNRFDKKKVILTIIFDEVIFAIFDEVSFDEVTTDPLSVFDAFGIVHFCPDPI